MRILITTILATGLIFGTAGLAHAQLGGLLSGEDKATGSILNQVTGQSSSGVLGQATSQIGGSVLGQASGASGLLGNSAPGSLTSSTLSGSETITAGKVLLGGGSTTDVAVAVGRSRVNSQISGITGGSSSSGLGGFVGGGSSSPGLGGLVGGTTSSSGLDALTDGGVTSTLGNLIK